MTPAGFEEFCSELLARVGVEDVQTTRYAKDGGMSFQKAAFCRFEPVGLIRIKLKSDKLCIKFRKGNGVGTERCSLPRLKLLRFVYDHLGRWEGGYA